MIKVLQLYVNAKSIYHTITEFEVISLMQQYDNKTEKLLPLNLPKGQKRHVPVAHDKCYFHANNQVDTVWL